MLFWLLLADSEGEKRILFGQADEADILVGGESRRQGRMAMWKMQCTARLIALRCDGRCTALRHLPQDAAMCRGVWQAYHCRAVPSLF